MIQFIITVILIELLFKPRLDFTREKKLLIWYGRRIRNYVVLF